MGPLDRWRSPPTRGNDTTAAVGDGLCEPAPESVRPDQERATSCFGTGVDTQHVLIAAPRVCACVDGRRVMQ